jgi:hypothetical protein
VLNDVLDEVDSAVEAVLANITLKETVGRLKPCVRTVGVKSDVVGVKNLSAAAVVKRKNGKEHTLSARN